MHTPQMLLLNRADSNTPSTRDASRVDQLFIVRPDEKRYHIPIV